MPRTYRLAVVFAICIIGLSEPAASAGEPQGPPQRRASTGRVRFPDAAVIRPLTALELTRAGLVPRRRAPQAASRDGLTNGILIGAAAGAAYGTLTSALLHAELGTGGVVGVLVSTTATGAGIGALIDWLR